MNEVFILSIIFISSINIPSTEAHLIEGIYCGKKNCYDVLGVNRDSTRNEIAKNYRQLARKYHPDLQKGEEAKKIAEEQFKEIATAYEILKDEDERTDYDYMLDNPEQYYAHYYRYYRRRMAPRIDVRIVIAVTITIISVIQYCTAWQKYETAIKYFMTIPKYRNTALDLAKDEAKEITSKKGKKLTKAQQKEETEKLIRKVIEEKMDIKGAYAKPEITDILWIQLIILPFTIVKYIIWYTQWIWRFYIKQEPYGEEEKLYLIRKNMKMGLHQFNSLIDSEKEAFLQEELWIREKYLVWKAIHEEECKKALAENTKYKQYRRYLKQHGSGRITFDDS